MKIVAPLEDMSVVCDRTQALMMLLNDGVMPSKSGRASSPGC